MSESYGISEGRGKSHSSINATRAERSPALSRQSPLARSSTAISTAWHLLYLLQFSTGKLNRLRLDWSHSQDLSPKKSPNLLAYLGDQEGVLVAGACVLRMHANPPCALLTESRGHIGRNQYMQLLQKLLLYLRDASGSCRGQSSSSSAVT